MPKRKWEISSTDLQISAIMSEETKELPLTPARGKRRRQLSDVIDSMGEQSHLWTSPASSSGVSSAYGASPSSSGFVTPQRRAQHCSISATASPYQGYFVTPEREKSVAHWLDKKGDSRDAFGPKMDEDCYSYMVSDVCGKISTHKDDNKYNMNHQNRGKCVIFNHEVFDTGFEARDGSTADALRIKQTFEKLGFNVEICEDYEHSAVINKITELSKEDHTNNDCICIFVLTHGLKNDLICAKDVVYKIDTIWKPFTAEKCVSLAGKPKLFFIQACRGDQLDEGVRMNRSGTSEIDSSTTSYKIPTHADFLFAYSTAQGFFSWRNPAEGTWFVQSLCDIIDEHALTTDLIKMLTMTARKVATDFASYDNLYPFHCGQKQVPSITSMLIRDVYFTPKNG